MPPSKTIWTIALATALCVPAFAQGRGSQGGPPPGQRGGRGGFGQSSDPSSRRGPGPHFGDWLRNSKNLTASEKQKALEKDPNFQNLPADRQKKLRERLEWFNALPPDRQQQILTRMEAWQNMTPEQHQRARALFDRMRALPDERRNALRDQFRALLSMPPEQRQKTMNSDQFKKSYNDEERDILTRWLELRDSNPSPPSSDQDD
ncbi:MAG TPA: DUF3106 domain-containing protein [Terriglobales bacterium]|nr:DUF3106 domain-containing protein [Terriglobales bacterium]